MHFSRHKYLDVGRLSWKTAGKEATPLQSLTPTAIEA